VGEACKAPGNHAVPPQQPQCIAPLGFGKAWCLKLPVCAFRTTWEKLVPGLNAERELMLSGGE
jgi:hypothetical protein